MNRDVPGTPGISKSKTTWYNRHRQVAGDFHKIFSLSEYEAHDKKSQNKYVTIFVWGTVNGHKIQEDYIQEFELLDGI